MRAPLLALHRQNYERSPESYVCAIFEEKRWSPERLAPIVGEKKAEALSKELEIPPLWLYVGDELYDHYWSVECAFEDMELLRKRGVSDAKLLPAPPKERLAEDFKNFLLDFS